MQYDREIKLYIKRILTVVILIIILFTGVTLLDDRKYIFCGIVIVLAGCVMMYHKYARVYGTIRRNVIIAVLTTMGVVGRCIFAPIPGFKPVTAIIIISAVYIGEESGFMVGSFIALVSDLVFGLGPWTPFQMVAWGLIGYAAGMKFIADRKNNMFVMIMVSAAGGIFYSLFMDVWSVISITGVFEIKKYLYYIGTSLPYMGIYILSNVIFMLLLKNSIGEKLERINKKHRIF